MKTDELRRALQDLAAAEPVDLAGGRQAVARRSTTKAQPPLAMLLLAACIALVLGGAGLLLASHDHSRVRVTGRPPNPTTGTGPATVPPTTAPTRAAIVEDLTFTGTVTGRITSATVADRGEVLSPRTSTPTGVAACSNAAAADPSAPHGAIVGLHALLGGRPLLWWWVVGDTANPGSGFGDAGFTVGPARYIVDPSEITADADRLGGSVDGSYLTASRIAAGHVKGHFRCAAPTGRA